MELFLTSLQGNNLKGDVLLSAVLPLLKLLCMASIGLLLAHPKYQLVPKATFTFLSRLLFAIFLPCLIFTNLGPSITLAHLLEWWFIPVNVVLSTAIGCVLGVLVALVCRPPPQFFRLTVIMTAFGNTGNLPLAIVASVCHSDDNLFGTESGCTETGIAYVSFSQWVSIILVYTLVYHMMEPTLEGTGSNYAVVVEEEQDHEIEELGTDGSINGNGNGNDYGHGNENGNGNENDLCRPLLVEAEWPFDKETEHCKTPFIARLFHSSSVVLSQDTLPDLGLAEENGDQDHSRKSSKPSKCLAEPRVVKKIRYVAGMTPIHGILQPATIASLLAIVIGMIPTLKSFVFGDDTLVSFITDSLRIVAEAMVPSAVLVLGGMLAEGPNESSLGMRTTIGIIVARLLVLPLIGIGVITLADKWHILVPGDQLFRFVLLLQYTTPSAILLGAVANLRGYAVREASALLFWQHIVAVFSLSFYIILYFQILL